MLKETGEVGKGQTEGGVDIERKTAHVPRLEGTMRGRKLVLPILWFIISKMMKRMSSRARFRSPFTHTAGSVTQMAFKFCSVSVFPGPQWAKSSLSSKD